MLIDLNYKDLLYDNEEKYTIDTEYIERIIDEREKHKLIIFFKECLSPIIYYYTDNEEEKINNLIKMLKDFKN